MNDDLGIGAGLEDIALFFQPLLELEIVINLAIEDTGGALRGAVHRLRTVDHANYLESSDAQDHVRREMIAAFIRTTMDQEITHSRHVLRRHVVASEIHFTGDS